MNCFGGEVALLSAEKLVVLVLGVGTNIFRIGPSAENFTRRQKTRHAFIGRY